jgi:predicted HTH domain antitoxin
MARSGWYTLVMSSVPATPHTKLCTLAVELPESVAKLLGATSEEATRHLAELAYIELFRQGQVSSGWAAERLGIRKDDFRELLSVHDVPYIDMSEEELRREGEVAMSLRRARSTS